ncbi:hypothetical protein Tco_0019005 [Tanacetum coccineum]
MAANMMSCCLIRSFGKHLEEKHVTWTQFGKKQDKNATLHNFDQDMVYRSWRRRQDFYLTSSVFQGEDVKVAGMKKS